MNFFFQLLLGEHNYADDSETEHVRVEVEEINNHPFYLSSSLYNDFSMIKMAKAVDFAAYPNIRPVCLPTDETDTFAGDTATVTGWGTTSSDGDVSTTLREAF